MGEKLDIVIVGGGAMGSAAAWQAAQRGLDVVLLEQFDFGHHHGASHGATRNFNEAYDRADYVDLVVEARRMWNTLAEEHGETLLESVGLVNHGHLAPLLRVRAEHERVGIDSVFLSPGEAAARWPGLRFRSEVLHVPGGGRVRADEALIALRAAAERRSALFRYESPVRSIDVVGPDEVVVGTDDAEYRARRVIVTAGAWTTALLGSRMPLPRLVVTEEHPAHFRPRVTDIAWPSFNHSPDPDAPEDAYWLSAVYGMLTPGEGLKAGWHGVGAAIDPDHRPHHADPGQLAALRRYVGEWLPGADPDVFDVISCTYTMTADEDFVLDREGPVVVGAGFSGHGFKFTPAIGRILVDLAEGLTAPARFRLGR
ncbi:FAD-dependent oxidoreductase [Microbacteriaceae bacterium VKM Ac-2855]|nr:FAD-dependent oxidoreductase [Microbacteriaceae bacterium VKM Ac-2855]